MCDIHLDTPKNFLLLLKQTKDGRPGLPALNAVLFFFIELGILLFSHDRLFLLSNFWDRLLFAALFPAPKIVTLYDRSLWRIGAHGLGCLDNAALVRGKPVISARFHKSCLLLLRIFEKQKSPTATFGE